MLLIALAIAVFALGIYASLKTEEFSFFLLTFVIFIIFLAMGLGADIGTYKEPELVEETEIYPLHYLLKGADEKLYVSVDNTAEPQITYYVVKDTRVILNDAAESFILDSKNEVRIVIGDEAKLQEYIVKPEFNLFSFRIGRERTEYVLVVPGDGINNIYSMGGD